MANSTATATQLKDPNITFYKDLEDVVIKGKKSVLGYGKLTYTPVSCPCCHCENKDYSIVKNGTRTSRIKIVSISGLNAYVDLQKQRYYCKNCGHSFTAKTDEVEAHCHISKRLKLYVMDQLTETVTEKFVSKLTNVSQSTVRRVLDEASKPLRMKSSDILPKHLCFDEFKSVKSSYASMSFLYCDADSHRLIDIVEDRRCHNLINYFMRFSLQCRQRVETVSIDMYSPYMNVINTAFPRADIIIDRFHIVQSVNRALNKTRVRIMNQNRAKNHRLYNKYKRYWKLLLAKQDILQTYPYQTYGLFDWMTNTSGIVDYLLDQSEELKATYRVAHSLREALSDNDFKRFKQTLFEAKHLPISNYLNTSIRTFKKLLPYIENTFRYPMYTNGVIEGLNNKIKVLKRNAYGYRNYAHFKARICLVMKLYVPDVKKWTTQAKAA